MDVYFKAPKDTFTENNVTFEAPNYYSELPQGALHNCRWKATSPHTLAIVKGVTQTIVDAMLTYTDTTQLTYAQWQAALPEYS